LFVRGISFQRSMLQVSTGTKRSVSPTRHHRDPDLVIFFYLVEVLRKLPAKIRIE
jgi:hypothetical protein